MVYQRKSPEQARDFMEWWPSIDRAFAEVSAAGHRASRRLAEARIVPPNALVRAEIGLPLWPADFFTVYGIECCFFYPPFWESIRKLSMWSSEPIHTRRPRVRPTLPILDLLEAAYPDEYRPAIDTGAGFTCAPGLCICTPADEKQHNEDRARLARRELQRVFDVMKGIDAGSPRRRENERLSGLFDYLTWRRPKVQKKVIVGEIQRITGRSAIAVKGAIHKGKEARKKASPVVAGVEDGPTDEGYERIGRAIFKRALDDLNGPASARNKEEARRFLTDTTGEWADHRRKWLTDLERDSLLATERRISSDASQTVIPSEEIVLPPSLGG